MWTDPALILMGLCLPILLIGSGFFSASETALFSMTQHQRRRLTQSRTMVGAALARLLAERRDLLITVLLSNMTINVLYFVISTVLLLRLRAHEVPSLLLAVLTPLPLLGLILLGEVLPKLLAARLASKWSQVTALPMLLVHRGLGPVRLVLNHLVITPLARLIAPPQTPPPLSAEELESLLKLSERRGVIEADEQQMLQQVLSLGQLKVKDLMTPRVDIQAFDLEQEPTELVELMRQTGLSKVPVYRRNLDEIVGVAYARQVLLRRPTTHEQLMSLVRQVMLVPELQRADRLLVQLRKTGSTLAIAVDEYGGTAGLATLEDLAEHMVGQIAGPYESPDKPAVEPLEQGVWRVSADLPVHEWVSVFGPIGQWDNVSTMGGLVMAMLGRLPQVGDRTVIRNIIIEVEVMQARRIESLLIRLDPQVEQAGEP